MIPAALKNIFFVSILILACQTISAQENNCDYFGLTQPSTNPKDFNPDLLDLNGSFKFNLELKTCDQIYFTTIDNEENIYFSEKKNGKWSKPKRASFSDPSYGDADPFLSKDGTKIYFISKRPTKSSDKKLDWNIWYADKKDGVWTDPKTLPSPINSDDSDEYFFSISNKGNVYFSSNRKGGEGSFDIYTASMTGEDSFSKPKNVGQPISTAKYEFDPYISPDEKLIIFSINERGNSSLYYSYKDQNNRWTTPQNLGGKINLTSQDFAPSLSADGKFLFYSNNGKLRWVSTRILKTAD